ncbi:hypothetical protein SmJEL517_g05411 [Synchytrium microbalum]|uniref:Calcium-transporting ATPase 2 n=1 Tax=Synchytrium microbalum TaxID=1806994 RepID=A0A507C0Z2_9FUNG|nr:uncharacterized protein SmJEL517_g05411 [Synchytrium microbalum]TPX31173.1 hypothetical protein SmJEL517_g05411 [Synchytrium microbalum]
MLPPLKTTPVSVTASYNDNVVKTRQRSDPVENSPPPPVDVLTPTTAVPGADNIPLTANAASPSFALTAENLGAVVNFDNRNDEALLNTLVTNGGVEGISEKLNVNLEKGLQIQANVQHVGHGKVAPENKAGTLINTTVVDADERRKVYGANVIPPPRSETILELVWGTIVEDPIIKILIFGAIVVISLGSAIDPTKGWIDGIAILIAVVLVLSVTAGNDYSKDKKFKKLLLMQSDKRTRVMRAGITDQVSSWDVLVGDLVVLETGDEVPADGLFVRGNRLVLDESPLTGESLPVKKNPSSPFMFSGCQVAEGSGIMLVTAVGPRSSGGQIQELLNQAQTEETVLQQKLGIVAMMIGKVGVAAGLFTFVGLAIQWGVQFAQGQADNEITQCMADKSEVLCRVKELAQFFVVGITIVVVAVPEGLPLAVTISLAFSMFKMIKEKCFVRHLDASETMGEATCICTDKTGTLTENRMAVVKAFVGDKAYNGEGSAEPDASPYSMLTFDGRIRELLAEGIAVNSTCLIRQRENGGQPAFIGSATEGALLVFSSRLGADYERTRATVEQVENGLWTFSSSRKRMSSLVVPRVLTPGNVKPSKYRLYTKGASEIVLNLCKSYVDKSGSGTHPLTADTLAVYQRVIRTWASEGLRTLALAYRDSDVSLASESENDEDDLDRTPEHDLVLLCIVGIKDPVRREVPGAVAQCQRAGLTVRMVTGDNVLTACKIARECGIFTDDGIALEGPEFRAMSLHEKLEVIPRLQVLARSSPADKHTLVTLLKEMGEVVAVTGDGTNDAPALKEADVGFAMGICGTQIAMNASDIVLLDDNFVSLVSAIKWGRNVLNCVRKFLQFQLGVNLVAVVLTFVGSMTVGTPPLNTVQLLWVNLIMDTLGALALASDDPDDDILLKPPHARNESLISRPMREYIIIQLFFQLMVLLALLLRGDDWVPYDHSFHVPDDLAASGPSIRTLTMVFAVFVFMQVSNEIMARQLNGELNIFKNFFKNQLFLAIMVIIVVIQVLVIEFGGDFVGTTKLDWIEWLISILLAALNLPFTVIARASIKHAQGRLFKAHKHAHTSHSMEKGDTVAPLTEIKSSRASLHIHQMERRASVPSAFPERRRSSVTVRNVYHGASSRPRPDGITSSTTFHTQQGQDIHNAVVIANVSKNLNKSMVSLKEGSSAGGRAGSSMLYASNTRMDSGARYSSNTHLGADGRLSISQLGDRTVVNPSYSSNSGLKASSHQLNDVANKLEQGGKHFSQNKLNQSMVQVNKSSNLLHQSTTITQSKHSVYGGSSQHLASSVHLNKASIHNIAQPSAMKRQSRWATLRASVALIGGLSEVRQANYVSGQGPDQEFVQGWRRYSHIPNPIRNEEAPVEPHGHHVRTEPTYEDTQDLIVESEVEDRYGEESV